MGLQGPTAAGTTAAAVDDADATASAAGERTCYVYDASGQRVRKVTEQRRRARQRRTHLPRRLRDLPQARRPIGADTATLERETLHVMDDKQRIALVETRTLDTAATTRRRGN